MKAAGNVIAAAPTASTTNVKPRPLSHFTRREATASAMKIKMRARDMGWSSS